MSRVKKMWDSFACAVIPPDAPEAQYLEMRRAFYAGAMGLISAISEMKGKLPSKEFNKAMDETLAELMKFSDDVKHGRA